MQRLALVDAAAWWLSEPNGGEEFAYALLAASCAAEVTTEHAYLTLITPLKEDQIEQSQRHGACLCPDVKHTDPPGQAHRPTFGAPQGHGCRVADAKSVKQTQPYG